MSADYSINSGYVHWRKENYLKELAGSNIDINSFEGINIPKSSGLNTKAIQNFLQKYVNPMSIDSGRVLKKSSSIDPEAFKNLGKDIFEAFEASGVALEGSIRKHKKYSTSGGKNSRITGKDVDQLNSELKNLIKYLNDVLTNLKLANKSTISKITQLQKEFQDMQKRLEQSFLLLNENRRSWRSGSISDNSKKNILVTNQELNQMISKMEEIQSLFTLPSDQQYWRLVEIAVGNLQDQFSNKVQNEVGKMVRSLTSADVSQKLRSTQLGALTAQLYHPTKNPYGFLDRKIIKQNTNISLNDPASGSVIETSATEQTIDAFIHINDPNLTKDFGTNQLRASIKSYLSGDREITLVSGSPLTTILEMCKDTSFLTHYMNIASVSRVDGSNQDYLSGKHNLIIPFIKKLGLLRGLVGVRGSNYSPSSLSNVLFYNDGYKWEVYDSFEIANRSVEALNSAVNLQNYPYNGVGMNWVAASNGAHSYLGARERISKLYADLHRIKITVSLKLNQVRST